MKNFIVILIICLLATACDQSKKETTAINPNSELNAKEKSIALGQEIYSNMCMTCHMSQGEGVASIYPPVANSNWVKEKRNESIKSIKNGLKGPIKVNGKSYDNIMSPLGLSNIETAHVMNYISYTWNAYDGEPVTAQDVQHILGE